MSYNFDAGGRGKTIASCKVYAEPSTGYAGIAALAFRVYNPPRNKGTVHSAGFSNPRIVKTGMMRRINMRARFLLVVLATVAVVVLFQILPHRAFAEGQAPAALTGQVTSDEEGPILPVRS